LPTCVGLRYGHPYPSLETFLDSLGSASSLLVFAPRHLSGFLQDGFACLAPYWLGRTRPTVRLTYPPVSSLPQSVYGWHRIFNRFSIAYAFRPQLRSRLTLGGRAFPRKPQAFGEGDSHPFYRLLIPAFSLLSAPPCLPT
jgi:hypothetical protein